MELPERPPPKLCGVTAGAADEGSQRACCTMYTVHCTLYSTVLWGGGSREQRRQSCGSFITLGDILADWQAGFINYCLVIWLVSAQLVGQLAASVDG